MLKSLTGRGFGILKFKDAYRHECSLQRSSSIDPHVWLGLNSADPQIMARDAAEHGVHTSETTGWVPYPIPREVSLHTRMHLNKRQCWALGWRLIWFALTERLLGRPQEHPND